MNAYALLSAQGWRGTGHSLHKTDDSIGLAKPLLLPRKDGRSGIGKTQHFTSDQWWMNAFDEQLKGLDTTQEGRVTQTVTTGKLNSIERAGVGKYYLYTSFVRGGFLEGTLSMQREEGSPSVAEELASTTEASLKESKEERRARRAARRRRKEERALKRLSRRLRKEEPGGVVKDGLDRDASGRRAKKREKRRTKEDKAVTL